MDYSSHDRDPDPRAGWWLLAILFPLLLYLVWAFHDATRMKPLMHEEDRRGGDLVADIRTPLER